jgi:hypothetical protein
VISRVLGAWQKRPTMEANETYYEAKETYYGGKRERPSRVDA